MPKYHSRLGEALEIPTSTRMTGIVLLTVGEVNQCACPAPEAKKSTASVNDTIY